MRDVEDDRRAAVGHGPSDRRAAREAILNDPDLVLSDDELMNALLRRRDGRVDRRIADLRDARIARLEASLSRLRAAHRDVVQAAWETLSHLDRARGAIVRMLEAAGPEAARARVCDDAPDLFGADRAAVAMGAGPDAIQYRRCRASDARFFGGAAPIGSIAVAPLYALDGAEPWGAFAIHARDPHRFGGARDPDLFSFIAEALGRIGAPRA